MPGQTAQAKLIDPASALSQEIRRKFQNAFYSSGLYRLLLRGKHPVTFKFLPHDPWPGDAALADILFRGEYAFAGTSVSAANQNPWRLTPPSESWAKELHSFSWLRHFRAQGGEAAQRHVEALMKLWLDDYGQWHPFAWQPDLIARRLTAWLRHAQLTASTRDLVYHSAVMSSMARQARHLQRTAGQGADGLPRLIAAIGLVYTGVCLPDSQSRLKRGLERLEKEIARQILPDGGCLSRSPSDQLKAVEAMASLRRAFREAGYPTPVFLQAAIDRAAPMVRFFRHDDGSLALFHGGNAETQKRIEAILALAEAKGQPVQGAIHSGFQRVEAGEMVFIMDTGKPPEGSLSATAHTGLSSFEFSAGGCKIVTNCGSSEQMPGAQWHRMGRMTAAHSSLVIGDVNACGILDTERLGRRPKDVTADRSKDSDGTRIETSHDGYRAHFGLRHRRIVLVADDGSSLIGCDRVEPIKRRPKDLPTFDARFHLHPDVTIQQGESSSVHLILPDGQQWRFDSHGGTLSIEESVYLGAPGTLQPTRQLVVSGEAAPDTAEIQWRFVKVEPFSLEP